MQAARKAPEDAEAVGRFGMALEAHAQHGAAAQCFVRAAALDGKAFRWPYFAGMAQAADGKFEAAAENLRKAVAIDGGFALAKLRLADALVGLGKAEEAQRIYRELMVKDPRLAEAHYGLGRTLRGAEAIAAYREALRLYPRYGAAQFALAGALRQTGDLKAAEEALKGYEANKLLAPPQDDGLLSEIQAMDASATGLVRKAAGLEREGKLAEAVSLHLQAVQQDPKMAQAWINLISLYGRTGDAAKAEEAYGKAVELAPGLADGHYNYGVLCLETKRGAEAVKAFEQALKADPRHPGALFNLAGIAAQTGKLDRAAELFRKTLVEQPENRSARFQLGRIYANQGQNGKAVEEFVKALEPADEQTPTIRYAMGAVLARMGKKAEAVAALQQAGQEAAARGQGQLAEAIGRDLGKLGAAH